MRSPARRAGVSGTWGTRRTLRGRVVAVDGDAPDPMHSPRPNPSRRRHALPLALAFAAMLSSAPGQSFLFAVFVDHILAGTGLSRTAFSALYAAATVVSATLSFGLGHAADRIGIRASWAIVAVGLAAACLLESLATGLVLAAAGLALLRSFGQGSFPLLGTLVVNHWYPRRRGAAMATASFGVTTASIALPPLLALLIDGVGWRTAYRLIALVLLVAVLPLAALVRTPDPAAHVPPAADAPPPDSPAPRVARRVGRARLPLPNRSAALLLVALSTPSLVTTAVTFHAVSLLASRGIDAPAAAAALSLLGIAAAAGTLATGALADRLGTRRVLAVLTGTLTVGGAVLLVPNAAASYLAFAVIGLCAGVRSVVNGTVWAHTYGLASLGRIQGLASAATIAAAAAGPLPLALSEGATGSYTAGLLFLLATAALALAAALAWHAPRPAA